MSNYTFYKTMYLDEKAHSGTAIIANQI